MPASITADGSPAMKLGKSAKQTFASALAQIYSAES